MDKEFFMNSSTPHQMQYDHPFSSTMPTWQTHDYFISTQPPNDHFESTFSSMVSSPTSNSALSTDNFMVRELIGKLGNICNTNDIPNYMNNGNCSTNNSCYTTPLSSPPKLGMSMPIMDHMVEDNFPSNGYVIGSSSDLPAMPGDPGFAERAARFSSLGSRSFNGRTTPNNQLVHRPCSKLQRVLSSPSLKVDVRPQVDNNNNNNSNNINNNCLNEKKQSGDYVNDQQAELSKSRENSSISGQNNQVKQNGSSRKRKAAVSKKNEDEIGSYSQMPNHSNKVGENRNDSNAKRSRAEESNDKEGDDTKPDENKEGDDGKNQAKQLAEPPKDYIHVRARRGQATDSHSLAERVRREKIGERMKLLQDLVPGCNKVTGKALMLDEIINYVQSLQRQVESLSMKLSNVNPRLEMNMCNPFSKEAIQPNCTLTHPMYSTIVPNQYGQQPHHQNPLENSLTTAGSTNPYSVDPLNTILNLNNHHNLHLPPIDGFANYLSQLPSLCEGDLQSIVEMGFGQKENGFQTQTLHGSNPTQMKIEF